MKKGITSKRIRIQGSLHRNDIVKKVVNIFIENEYHQKGKGVTFRYPVEKLPKNKYLYISRPGHKKNFDFKVEITEEMVIEEGKHNQIAMSLREAKRDNPKKFNVFLEAMSKIFHCTENDIDRLIKRYPNLKQSFQNGVTPGNILKILKWMFIMEDIVYWDVEGRAFLYNYLLYVVNEEDEKRLEEAMEKVKTPDRLKSFMKKAGIIWTPYKD
jgi:hypothetical protein